ncbi:FAD-dependent monooxygenase [Legionella sp. CNM-4043-24]|uniref:FAD-dependent monooxygenase n=1 Tax=Legionella sp. CNM-4043-24 TaxID=3421646 RepID=UPI00403A9728
MNANQQVLIAGAGPVGLLLACNLMKAGINVTLIDKNKQCSTQSKALTLNAASLKILRSIGIDKEFLAKGKIVKDITVYWNNKRLMHIDYRHLPSIYKCILSLPQPDTEFLLCKYLEELGGSVLRETELVNAINNKSSVSVELSNGTKSEFAYVVGCDGGSSTVRKLAGQTFEGHNYGIEFLLIDAKIQWDGFINEVHYFVKKNGFIIIIPLENGCHRIVIKEDRNYSKEKLHIRSQKEYQELLDTYGPGDIIIKQIDWRSSAPFYNRITNSFQNNRLFLAGDSCHLFSPIGGMGMNTGFQDAFNLGWKLAGVINKKLNRTILGTYHTERNKIANELLVSTDITTCLITGTGGEKTHGKNWLPIMSNRNRMRSLLPMDFSGLSQQYDNNLINIGSNHLIGSHVPYIEFNNNGIKTSSYDLADGVTGVLLVFGDKKNTLMQRLNQYPLNIYFLEQSEYPKFKDYSLIVKWNDAVFIRPDGYIGWQGSVADPDSINNYLKVLYIQFNGENRA